MSDPETKNFQTFTSGPLRLAILKRDPVPAKLLPVAMETRGNSVRRAPERFAPAARVHCGDAGIELVHDARHHVRYFPAPDAEHTTQVVDARLTTQDSPLECFLEKLDASAQKYQLVDG